MNINKTTLCGRCGAAMRREVGELKETKYGDQLHAVYSCLNDDCDRAWFVVLKYNGETQKKGFCGVVSDISKSKIESRYEKE